jgi:DMSO/TMAO reductase YedYZ molybdopterin-dependent catalytic subunit
MLVVLLWTRVEVREWGGNMIDRRQWLAGAGALALSGPTRAWAASAVTLPFANGERPLVRYPGKRPLIGLTARPPQLETPFEIFNDGAITPNDAFFVRYHLAGLPTSIDPDSYRIAVEGKVATPLSLSLADLKSSFTAIELVAVNQCSGNSRGFSDPRVGGGQLGNGAMGNARWKGVKLSDVLARAGVATGAVQVTFDGLDAPLLSATPDFVKALDIDHAQDGEVMIAYEMNGEPLPFLNGYPVRLVVPGYYGTYWVKHLSRITVTDAPFTGFWMSTAYRVPDNDCHCVEPGTKPKKTVPIGRLDVRSFITSLRDGQAVAAGPLALRGIAFDGGYGISDVLVSADGRHTWAEATLGPDLGKYSFREWHASVPLAAGTQTLAVRAVNRIGQTQPDRAMWNPSGYMRNAVETVTVQAG